MKSKRIAKFVCLIFTGVFLISSGTVAIADGGKKAKHIILMIGDGMNIEHEIATSRYLFGSDYDLSFHKLPYQANVATWDVSAYNKYAAANGKPNYDPNSIDPKVGYDPAKGGKKPYPLGPELEGAEAYNKFAFTDSASAATAWATGLKTDDGNIAWLPGDPSDGAIKTIAEILRDLKGYSIGVVSTVPFTHATPAAHVSHNKSRNCYKITSQPYCEKGIDNEILTQVKPEVVIGGGYPAGSSYVSTEAFAAVSADSDYKVVTRATGTDGGVALLQAAQQAATEGKKLFGLFGGLGGNFESIVPYDLPSTPLVTQFTRENPTYAEATLAALKVLSQDEDGFFLMTEQGDIDWANHANDFGRMVGTTKDLHDGVQAVIDFVNQPDDDIDWDNTLLIVTADHSNSYMRNKEIMVAGDLPEQVPGGSCPPGYGGTCPNYPGAEVTYGSTAHTNELVRLYAMGAGVKGFDKYEGDWYKGTKILDNTQIFHMMMGAAGVKTKSELKLK